MSDSETILRCDQLMLNKALKTVEFQNQPISLSPTSFELLSHLMQQAPAVVSVDELLEKVWNNKVVNRETVKQQIKSLRDQLGEAAGMIESLRGFGYQIKSPQTGRKESGLESENSIKNSKIWLTCLLIMVIAGLLWFLSHPIKSGFYLPLKTATLPFKLLDSTDQDLVLILQGELTNMMARQEGVKAISVSALEHAKYKNYSLKEYAELLNVDVLFEGSIQELDTGYQVNVRMVWTRNSFAVWPENISIEGKDRKSLLNKTRITIEKFIQKKVAHIKSKAS